MSTKENSMKFLGEIKDKYFDFGNIKYVRFHLSRWEGSKVVVTVEKAHNKRSVNQNRYYWMILGAISYDTGHTPDELHTIFKSSFLPKKHLTLNGKQYVVSGSTTDLSKGQFVEYMMHIQAEAGQLGIKLPSIEEYKRGLDEAILSTD